MEDARELTAWKAIADYLGVHVRTAQGYERHRGLPIQRLPGGRTRVSTTVAALEAWKHTGDQADPPRAADVIPSYRWPLGHGITAEVRFYGTPVTPAHLEVLRQYLDVAKTALQQPDIPCEHATKK